MTKKYMKENPFRNINMRSVKMWVILTCSLTLLALVLATGAEPAGDSSADLDALDKRVIEVLTPEQYDAFADGADAESLTLESGETLADFLNSNFNKGAVASGLVYHPVPTCAVALSWRSTEGAMKRNRVRDFVVRGISTNLSSQGGSATGCGIPTDAESIIVNIQAVSPSGRGRLKAWASDLSRPRGRLVDYAPTAESLIFNNATVLDLCLGGGCGSDFRVRAERAKTHMRIDVMGYFAPAPAPPVSGIPSGVITMWSGSLATIPSGWALCDGANGTPDLRDRFVLGTSTGEDPGATGGSSSHAHSTSSAGNHSHSGTTTDSGNITADNNRDNSTVEVAQGNHVHGVLINSAGIHSHNTNSVVTLPPYFKLAFIMKLP